MTSKYNPLVHRFANFVVAWTVLLFVAGALVTSNDAALSVPDWPQSFGTWFPTLSMLAGGAFFEHSHRVIAGVLVTEVNGVIQTAREYGSAVILLAALALTGLLLRRPAKTAPVPAGCESPG